MSLLLSLPLPLPLFLAPGCPFSEPFGNYSEWVPNPAFPACADCPEFLANLTYGPFIFGGRSARDGSPLNTTLITDVDTDRAEYLSSFTTYKTTFTTYSTPGFSILIKPSVGVARAE